MDPHTIRADSFCALAAGLYEEVPAESLLSFYHQSLQYSENLSHRLNYSGWA